MFRELNLIEQWGSGVPRMFEEADRLDLPGLHIDEIGMRFRFAVLLKEALAAEATEQVTEQVAKLLQSFEEEPVDSKTLMKTLGLAHRPSFLYDYLQPALAEGCIEMTIPDNPRSSKQRYRLTRLGLLVRRQLRDKEDEELGV